MRKFPSLTVIVNNFIAIIMTAILAVIWIAFAPLKIGGQASYVIVHGNSMEPGFHGNDLAIVKADSNYNVGEVVTYFEPASGEKIIHRIVGIKGNRYIFKGDNNSWIDPYRPTKDEILGKLWIHIPKLGRTILWLRLPINMALIVGILGGFVMIETKKQPNQHGKQKNKPSGGSVEWFEMTLYTLGFLTLAFLVLSVFFFSRPVTRIADDIEYEQTGIYYYSATSPAGIFDTEIIHSGEPIFTRLTCSIIIGFSYNITGPVQEVTGTQQLTAQITDTQSGWQRTIPLTASTAFSGTSYSTTAPIDLCQFQALVDTMGEKTGFRPNTTLTIISKMAVAAKARGQNVYDSFDSNLVFQFDDVHFYLVRNDETDPLQSSKSGVIANSNTQANTVKFLGFELNVLNMRILGIGGLSLSLLGLLILGWYVYMITQRSQETAIRIRYGSMLMDVYDRGFENTASVIEVTTIDDLAKLAERQNTTILHMSRDFLHYYFVQSDGTTYRYVNRENQNRQINHTVRSEVPPGEIDQNAENTSSQNTNDEPIQPNFIPKKVKISYDGPLPYNEQDDPK